MKCDKQATIVIHFNNNCQDIGAVIRNIRKQVYNKLQVLCVSDCRNNSRVNEAIREYGGKQFCFVACESEDENAAFNQGFSLAEGEYIYFMRSDATCENNLLESTCDKLEDTDGDLVLFDYDIRESNETTKRVKQLRKNWDEVKNKSKVLLQASCCGAVFRRRFLLEHGITFTESGNGSFEDDFFVPACISGAEIIAYIEKKLVTINAAHGPSSAEETMRMLAYRKNAADAAMDIIKEQPQYQKYKNAFSYFFLKKAVEPYINEIIDYSDPTAYAYYDWLKGFAARFSDAELDFGKTDNLLQRYLRVLQSYDADTYIELVNRKLFISLTSYPERLKDARKSINSLLKQTKKFDGVLLWLAREEYPNYYEDIPDDILALSNEKRITIKWCDKNLKPHKKYYYAFQEYPDDLIVTVDDDLIYQDDMLTNLFLSYLEHPKAVSAMRTHLICFDECGNMLPYRLWIKNSNVCVNEESMQLLATTGAGTLFLPGLLDPVAFNIDAIEKNCINADDLWLKCVELISGIPVVQAAEARELVYVSGTQKIGLWSTINRFENDTTLKQIIAWMDENLENGSVYKMMKNPEYGKNMMLAENIYEGIVKDREIMLAKQKQLEKELNKTKNKLKKNKTTNIQQSSKAESKRGNLIMRIFKIQ